MLPLTEIAFFTDNVAALTAFYQNLLGVDPAVQSEGMAIFGAGQTKLFIHKTYEPGAGELPPENHVAFTVKNVDDTCAELAQKGLVIEVEPQTYYWGRSAYLRDPDGQLIELIQAQNDTERS